MFEELCTVNKNVMNLGFILKHTAQVRPDAIGLVQGERSWTWGELERDANAIAVALTDLGISKGDRVLVQSPNNRYMYESQFAILRTGGVYAPINARASTSETIQSAQISQAKAIIVDASCLDNAIAAARESEYLGAIISTDSFDLNEGVDAKLFVYDDLVKKYEDHPAVDVAVDRDDHCWHCFTSGTTGVPKQAVHTHGALAFTFACRIADVLPGLDHTNATLAIAPISHGTGTTTTCCTIKGAKIVLLDSQKFDVEECWKAIERHRITNMFTVPTILMRMVKDHTIDKYDHSSLRHVMYAGAPISRPDQKVAIEKLGKVLVQYYGQAETMGTTATLYPDMHDTDDGNQLAPLGSCGVMRSCTEVGIFDDNMMKVSVGEVGEICTRSAANFCGYWNDKDATEEVFVDGWLKTGDLGKMDERGFIYIAGRSKQIFKSGGFQVYPVEICNCLSEHPAVEEAHVISLPDSEWGEIGVGVVSVKPGMTTTEGELIELVASKHASYKKPRRIFIVDEIPRTDYGKVSPQILKERLLERGLIKKGVNLAAYKANSERQIS